MQHHGLFGVLFSGALVVLTPQSVWALPTQVTSIKINPTSAGVDVVLQTQAGDRQRPTATASSQSNLSSGQPNPQHHLYPGYPFRNQ